jgi:hypothetical protein
VAGIFHGDDKKNLTLTKNSLFYRVRILGFKDLIIGKTPIQE